MPHRFALLLVPGLLQGVLSIAVLPFATLILTPADYGAYALVVGYAAVLGAVASMGASIILSNRFQPAVSPESRALVSSMLFMVLAASCLLALVSVFAFLVIGAGYPALAGLPFIGIVFALVDMIASSVWGIAFTIAILSRKVRAYAAFMTMRAVAVPAAVLSALFVLDIHGPTALFCGSLLGGLVFVAGTVKIAAPYIRPMIDWRLLVDLFKSGSMLSTANLLETAQLLVERSVIASSISLTATGIWTHAQLYPGMLMTAMRPAIGSTWPKLREEAMEEPASFTAGRHLSHLTGAVFATATVTMALIGREFIDALTNGRFVDAAPFATILTAALGLRLAGRPQHAIIIAHGYMRYATLATGLPAIGAMVMVSILVPIWGLVGAVIASVGYSLLFLGLIYGFAMRIRPTRIRDGGMFAGFFAALAALALVELQQPPFLARAAAAALVMLAGAVAALFIVRRSGLLAAITSRA